MYSTEIRAETINLIYDLSNFKDLGKYMVITIC